MKTNYRDFLKINESINRHELANRIASMKKWLVRYNGLNMMNIIDDILTRYKTKLTPEEINRFHEGLKALRKTDYPIDDMKKKLSRKLPKGISNATLVKEDGRWCYLNKLNTNYSDLSELLAYVIDRMLSDKNTVIRNFGNQVYGTIMTEDVEKGLLMLAGTEKGLKGIIEYYFIENGYGIQDFLSFTGNIRRNSQKGEIAEDKVGNYLIENKFTIEYQGGNGDFIDMIFGCDLIVYREDVGYKSVQVKAYMPRQEDVEYYNVDWIAAVPNGNISIVDKNTFQPIDLIG